MSLRSKRPLSDERQLKPLAARPQVTMKDVFGLHGVTIDDSKIYAPTGEGLDQDMQRLGEAPVPGAVLVGELILNQDGSSAVRPTQMLHKGQAVDLRTGGPIPYGTGVRDWVNRRMR